MKKQLTITARKRIAVICLFLLWGLGGFAQVNVTNLATDYAAKQISFTVTWTAQPYNNQIWVITDYIKIDGATTVGSWSRALVTAVTASGNGSAETVSGQRGFRLNVTANSGSANITATLSLASGVDKFNWCASALNYPPQAVIKAAGGYDLKGTPPFTVNGTTLGDNVKTFGAGTCITSLSDATNNPASVIPDLPALATSDPAARCGAGEVTLSATASGGTTTAMTYTWVVGGGEAQTTNSDSLSLSTVAVGSTTFSVTVTNANGCTSAQKTGTITVHTAVATASCTGNASNTCPATTVALTATASGATSFTWYKNGSSVQTGTSTAYTVTASDSYTVQGKNANCTGPTSSAKVVTISGCGDVPGCPGLVVYQTTTATEGSATWIDAWKACNHKNSHLPTVEELRCMCANKSTVPGGWPEEGALWSYEGSEDGYAYFVVCKDCSIGYKWSIFIRNYRCTL